MSSRFISAGSIDASKGRSPPNFHTQPPSIFHSEARQKEREEAAHQLEQSRQQSSRSGIGASAEAEPQRSLYEVLQANKAAKQAALEEARRLRDENAALRIDLVAATNAARIAEAEAAGLRDLQENLKEAVDAYAADLASRPEDGACRLGDSDIERLRKLR